MITTTFPSCIPIGANVTFRTVDSLVLPRVVRGIIISVTRMIFLYDRTYISVEVGIESRLG